MKFAWKVANRRGTADDILAMFQIPDGLRPLIFQRWKPRGCTSDNVWGKWPACLRSANQSIRPPPPTTRSLFPASFCYEVKIIDWEHREPSRRRRVRRGGAQGEKQIDKKGIKKARREEDVGSERDGVSKYRGGWGMKECANVPLRSLGLQERSMRTVRGWWEDKIHLWELQSFLGNSR